MNFKWYVYFLEKNDLLQSSNLEATLEKNFAYFALLLHRHLRVIMESKTSMLLQVLKFFFESSARDLRMSGEQLTAQFQSYKLRYDYIKQIDPSWSI